MYNNIALLIGHLVGDYILQNDYQAVNKSKHSYAGQAGCALHCFLYSTAVATCVVVAGWRTFDPGLSWPVAFVVAYVTHFPIDRWSLAAWWGKLIKQTSFGAVMRTRKASYGEVEVEAFSPRAFFVAPVYIAVDNTMHLILMWVAFSLLGG